VSSKIVVVTGASSGLGWLSVEALALAGHTVYASMRDVTGHNACRVEAAGYFAKDNGVALRSVEMDVQSTSSVNAAVEKIFNANGRIDVVVHNAGQMVFGPSEAFTPDQLTEHYDVNVVSTQRVNRAVLPHMRRQKRGLVVWISCSSSAGGTQPYLAPYFAAKAAMDSMAVGYARELARWGIETSIIVPGSFVAGRSHFEPAGAPADTQVVTEYEGGPYAGLASLVQDSFDDVLLSTASASTVADAVVRVVETPFGQRPFRIHVAPTDDGGDVGFAVLDRLKAEMLHRVGLHDLLKPARLI
jgi:NAD(P)-dependent dehydrogenase (short-subunit alcohol dehydrogenase family)